MTRMIYRGYKPVGGVISKVSGLVTLRTATPLLTLFLALTLWASITPVTPY